MFDQSGILTVYPSELAHFQTVFMPLISPSTYKFPGPSYKPAQNFLWSCISAGLITSILCYVLWLLPVTVWNWTHIWHIAWVLDSGTGSQAMLLVEFYPGGITGCTAKQRPFILWAEGHYIVIKLLQAVKIYLFSILLYT